MPLPVIISRDTNERLHVCGAKYTTITCGSMQINCASRNNAALTLVGPMVKVYATGPNKNYGFAPVISEPGLTGLNRLEVYRYAHNSENVMTGLNNFCLVLTYCCVITVVIYILSDMSSLETKSFSLKSFYKSINADK